MSSRCGRIVGSATRSKQYAGNGIGPHLLLTNRSGHSITLESGNGAKALTLDRRSEKRPESDRRTITKWIYGHTKSPARQGPNKIRRYVGTRGGTSSAPTPPAPSTPYRHPPGPPSPEARTPGTDRREARRRQETGREPRNPRIGTRTRRAARKPARRCEAHPAGSTEPRRGPGRPALPVSTKTRRAAREPPGGHEAVGDRAAAGHGRLSRLRTVTAVRRSPRRASSSGWSRRSPR